MPPKKPDPKDAKKGKADPKVRMSSSFGAKMDFLRVGGKCEKKGVRLGRKRFDFS